jgi:hypothetical protein
MADSGFFRNDSGRPDPPFKRTLLQNNFAGGVTTPTLRLNGSLVSASERKKYRLFKATQVVGEYAFTWHHNIPWNILRRSWDAVITFCTEESIRKLFDFYIDDHPLADEGPDLLKKMLALRKEEGIELSRKKGCPKAEGKTCQAWIEHLETTMKTSVDYTFSEEERPNLKVILCWGAWNLNEGPGTRVDDPGELFDAFGPFDATEGRKARYVAVERLNQTLNDIFNQYTELANSKCTLAATRNAWSDALMETMRVCEALTPSQRQIVYFDPLMWAPVTLSNNAVSKFNLDANRAETEDGMITEDLRGVRVFKQMKKMVRWKG